MPNNILVVAAHPDDEVLGAGGAILKHVQNGDQVKILILGDGETSRETSVDIKKRANQALAAGRALGAQEIILKNFPDNRFDSVPLLDMVKEIETVINRLKPNMVFTHNQTDLNLDHRLVSQAVLTACRPVAGVSVKKILAFEVPSSTEWQAKLPALMFCPNEYYDIKDQFEKKIKIIRRDFIIGKTKRN